MKAKPPLTLYVTTGCSACRRAEEVLRECDEIRSLASLEVVLLGEDGEEPPPDQVIGAPTVVFQGKVVALGTPDCARLAAELRAALPSDVVS